MNLLRKVFSAANHQLRTILAISTYDLNRKSTGSQGNLQTLIDPLQMMAFFLLMRIGFSFLRGNNRFEAGGGTDMYFNPVLFMATGFSIVFLFRDVALKALSGIKIRAPLYYARVKPIDILIGSSLNNIRALSTLSLGILILTWYFTCCHNV